MELKLVYRFLRQVSDWVVDNYYSEVVVEGEENVPIHGPIIIASTHHNEMIDIAALAAKLPHRRHLAFWAKASMFKNPLGRAVMTSSGAIPVRRNPNNAANADAKVKDGASTALSTEEELAARASLFRETTLVLKNDGVVGIFPEGTSCTGWRVFQTMPGAAWAALEYTRAIQGEEGAQGVKIVPVAITYTDKSEYLSRIHIRYGEPIRLDDYVDELLAKGTDPNVAAKSVASKVTAEIEARLVQITVNAPDWEAICATKTATQILWTDEDRIPLGKWVDFNQRFVALLDDSLSGGDLSVKDRLCKYNALLHYSGIEHRALASLLPSPTSTSVLAPATVSMLTRLPLAVLKFTLFFPSLLFVLPGYFTGPLAKRLLAKPEEEEGFSQFKAIAGGLGVGANIALLFGALWRFQDAGYYAGAGASHKLGRIAQTLGVTYLGATLLMRWHNLLVKGNYKNLKLLQTYWKILRFSASRSVALDASQLESYKKPPHPVVNPFIKSKYLSDLPPHPPHPPANSSKKLLAYLFDARRDAEAALGRHLDESTGNGGLRRVMEKAGAKVPVIKGQRVFVNGNYLA
ncbi:glycerol-3-phosphate O-acyltransferase [Ephemerocybe angulata]|uniref:Glycerol-3-phosphate O-acyltransferase n=1 Tax=Ephemerocybe angulata TaxID=980116 RepID=A0A8H6IAD9_9AGAR|nr:glycerol-3-phosphate O-acyltransferase [Tulosesus angulatus]